VTPRAGHVWYAAYGSNLSRERFSSYIVGGCPPGATRALPGCRDRTSPAAVRASRVRGELCFAKHSTNWGGAVAFLDVQADADALVVLYLLTEQQLDDVVAQENAWSPGEVTLPRQVPGDGCDLGGGFYPLVVCLTTLGGETVVTVTDRVAACARPTDAYLTYVAAGLRDEHGMSTPEIVEYLVARPGIAGSLTPDELAALAGSPT
jgi:hypothetical protein